jgi:CRISPR-associated protein Csm5
MHYERLRCQADGGFGTPGTVAITIDVDAIRTLPQMKSRKLWPMLRDGDDPWAYLQLACNTFYGGRFQAEWSDFAFLRSQAQGGPHWGISSWDGVWLLRVGRFSHFDSLSVDELRRGWNAQKRMVLEGLGATRTLCQLADGRRMAPMGWVLLKPLAKSAGTPPENGAKPA